ncbi:MAG: hypothetical protein AAGH78_18245, partial [Cyanobacteria bacterium P01_H01_bin.58]
PTSRLGINWGIAAPQHEITGCILANQQRSDRRSGSSGDRNIMSPLQSCATLRPLYSAEITSVNLVQPPSSNSEGARVLFPLKLGTEGRADSLL